LGVVPGIIGSLQAAEALKWILGIGESLVGRLLLFDALRSGFREVRVCRDPGCPVCGDQPSITALMETEALCAAAVPAFGGRDNGLEVGVERMREVLSDPALGVAVLDVREAGEQRIGLVSGTRPVPLSRMEEWITGLDPEGGYLLCCRSGQRSLRAARALRERGFTRVASVRGGLMAWVREVDSGFPLV